VSYLELFFDLGLIVALSRISSRLGADLGWLNVLESIVLLAAIWWVWTVTAYTTDWYDPELPVVQVIVIGVLFGGLLMAAAVASAYQGANGFGFAGPYVALNVFRGLLLISALRRHELRRRPLRVLIWFAATGVVWIVGAALPAPIRLGLWAIAVASDYSAGLFGYWVPRLGRTTPQELRVVGEHQSERYRQMFVVALGEILLVGAVKLGNGGFGSLKMVGVLLMFTNAVALWRLYLVFVGRHLAAGIEESSNPGRTALIAAYTHLIMVAGVALIATSCELLLSDPLGRSPHPWLAVLVAGPVVFLVGRTVYAAQTFRTLRWRQAVGIAGIPALIPALTVLPVLGAAALVNVVLLLIAFAPAPGPSRKPLPRDARTRW
jgi:low temperature requirement protein LtrA